MKTAFLKNFFCVCCIYLCLIFCQSKLEVKKEAGESPPSEAACLCSPPPAKNQCASCGMEIQDRYLLKVRNLKTNKQKTASYILCVGTNLRTTIIPSIICLFLFLLFFLFIRISKASTHQCVLIPPVFLRRLITWTGTWVVWNVPSAERLYANTTAATSKTKKSSANWIISGKMKVSLRRATFIREQIGHN